MTPPTVQMIAGVIPFADAASAALKQVQAPADAVDLSVQWLNQSERLSMDLRVRDEWARRNGPDAAERMVETLADALTSWFGASMFRHRSNYADGRTCLSRTYVCSTWAVSVTGWVHPDATREVA